MARLRLRPALSLLERTNTELAGFIALAAILDAAAAVGIAYLAGFHLIRLTLDRFDPRWLIGVFVGVVGSFAGYFWTYRVIYRADDGLLLSGRRMWAVVIAGFGGFLAQGGTALDSYALQEAGADKREASVRVGALGGLEHGAIGIIGAVAGIVALASGLSAPPLDVQIPWAVLPVPGFLVAFWLSPRYKERFRHRKGLAGKLGVLLDTIELVRHIFTRPLKNAGAMLGMSFFWLAAMFAAWSALAAFDFRMNGAAFILGYGTGAVFTRRTGPLGGAGILMLIPPITLMYAGAPLAAAGAGIFVYRIFSLWLTMPFSLFSLSTLRGIGQHGAGTGEEPEKPSFEPALRRTAG